MKAVKPFLILMSVFLALSVFAQLKLTEIEKSAENGDIHAQIYLCGSYYDGTIDENITQDYKKTIKWCTKAANRGDALSQYILGIMYQLGNVVSQDYKKAVEWVVH